MKAIVVEQTGGPEQLQLAERPEPSPGRGQLAVQVSAAGVNFFDIYQRQGLYPRSLPYVPGTEGAGRVIATGDGVRDIAVGDRVAWAMVGGAGYAEQVTLPAERAVPLPDGVDDETAAAVMLQGMTAHALSTSTYAVQPGEVALVHAGAGGVGLLLTQMVVARGGRVLTTASTPEKAELSRAAGAETVIDYTSEDVAARVRELTDGEGVHVVYDGVGADTFDASLDSLRRRGSLVLFGGSSGPVPPFDPQVLNRKGSLWLTRPTLGDFVATREELRSRADEVLGWVADGSLDVRIGSRYPLAEASRAHQDLAARRTTGKLLLQT
jgi:NADPH2:quinone reductase